MKQVFLLSSCDAWHSFDSYNAIGVFSSLKKIVGYLKKYDNLTVDDIELLSTIHQTQGRETNYCIEEFDLNPKI